MYVREKFTSESEIERLSFLSFFENNRYFPYLVNNAIFGKRRLGKQNGGRVRWSASEFG